MSDSDIAQLCERLKDTEGPFPKLDGQAGSIFLKFAYDWLWYARTHNGNLNFEFNRLRACLGALVQFSEPPEALSAKDFDSPMQTGEIPRHVMEAQLPGDRD